MKLKSTALLAVWIFIAQVFSHHYAQAQVIAQVGKGHTLKGKVTAADGKPLDGASVYLKFVADSSLFKTNLGQPDGSFSFTQVPAGKYFLVVGILGYVTYSSAAFTLTQDFVLPPIQLLQKGTSLKEVSVVAARPMIEHLIDRTVVNVEAILTAFGGTAIDALEKSPGVIVEQSGGISLQGKQGVAIYIDDKPTYLSGSSLENYLRSLPSSSIDRIELMPNPPARYDAAGNGGVINIRLKKNKDTGFNGNLTLAYNQGRYGKTNNSFNFNYRHKRVNLTANLGYSYAKNFSNLDINRYFNAQVTGISPNFLQNSFIRRQVSNYTARVGADYYISEKSTLGMVVSGLINPFHSKDLNTSQLLNAQMQPDSTLIANNDEGNTLKNGTINLNYRHEYDKKGNELTLDLDYVNYQKTNRQSFSNSSYLPDGTLYKMDLLTGTLPTDINIYSAKADYTRPLNNDIKLSAGLKTSYTNTDNIADYFYTLANETKPDYDKTNHFRYKENINAAYVNGTRDFKHLSIQLGIRFENTISDGEQLGNVQKADSAFRRTYNGLFPTLFLQYKLDTTGRQQLTFNYGRRVDRPYYEDLNPFLSPLDKFTYYTGNPFLKPSYSNEFELAYTYRNITATLSYSKALDEVNETIEIQNGIYYSRPSNLGSRTNMFVSIDADFNPTKWVNLHLYASFQQVHTVSEFYTGILDTKGNVFYTRPTINLRPGKEWTLQLTAGYQTKYNTGQFTLAERKRVDIALSKKLSPGATIKAGIDDVFKQVVNAGVINNLANTYADYHNVGDSRVGKISFSYRFGKTISNQRQHEANGAESEQNRVKN
jgi:outer membrane receptor protein involved in Fe transport